MEMKELAPRGFLTTCILKLLKTGPKHGYEIIKSIKEETGWEPSPGAVYPTLHDLKRKGLIEEKKVERRISYKLTTKGKVVTEEIEENMKIMKDKFWNFIKIMGQILEVKESDLRRIMEIHEKKGRDSFLLLPGNIKSFMIKARYLILKIAKDKSKHKELEKILIKTNKELEKIAGE